MVYMEENYKELVFRGPTKDHLSAMPTSVRLEIGQALWLAQTGKKSAKAKPLTGPKEFRGAKVLEIVSDDGPNTYRGVYTIEFEEAVYLLAAFQKKSKRGIATPQQDIDKIVDRIKRLHRDRDTPEGKAVIVALLQRKAARQTEIDRQKELKNDPKRK
jgi:phage-related protein